MGKAELEKFIKGAEKHVLLFRKLKRAYGFDAEMAAKFIVASLLVSLNLKSFMCERNGRIGLINQSSMWKCGNESEVERRSLGKYRKILVMA